MHHLRDGHPHTYHAPLRVQCTMPDLCSQHHHTSHIHQHPPASQHLCLTTHTQKPPQDADPASTSNLHDCYTTYCSWFVYTSTWPPSHQPTVPVSHVILSSVPFQTIQTLPHHCFIFLPLFHHRLPCPVLGRRRLGPVTCTCSLGQNRYPPPPHVFQVLRLDMPYI